MRVGGGRSERWRGRRQTRVAVVGLGGREKKNQWMEKKEEGKR
jgi:hypothetical protein